MNKNIQSVFNYHEQTKHNFSRYAKSLGYMDWANQPNPFREYENALEVKLPVCFENPTPPYHSLFENITSAPLMKNAIAQFL